VAWLQDWAYSLSSEGVWVHLYGSSVLETTWKGHPLALRQETAYPWEGAIRLTFERAPAGPMVLRLRIPAWAGDATATVNGRAIEVTPGSYASLERTWAEGDVITLTLNMTPRLVEAHPLIEEARNQLAVMRGPLVYCLESVDLPDGVRLCDVALPADTALDALFESDLLGGVVSIYAHALQRIAPQFQTELYANARSDPGKPVRVRLVPYFAWWNRGNASMSVWLPRA
jgi:DUF1680 family protein